MSEVIAVQNETLTQNEIDDKIRELRLLVLDDNVLKHFRTYDEYLLRFLYFKDFDVNVAYKEMQGYTRLMLKYPKWYPTLSNIDDMNKQNNKIKGFIKGRDRCGRRIYIVEVGRVNPSTSSAIEEACSDEIWFELVMDDPDTLSKGISVIVDVDQVTWRSVQWLTPSTVKTSAAKADSYPCKELLYHIVSNSTLVSVAVKLVWPFVSAESKKNVIFHFDNWSSLHEYISPDVLPPKYGGTGPEVDYDQLYTELFEAKGDLREKIAVDQKQLQKLL